MSKVQDVLGCSFSEWYPSLKKVTFRSEIIPLPQDFVDYLLADNVYLSSDHVKVLENVNSDDDSDADEWAKAEAETPELEAPTFEELDRLVRSAIAKLGGKVFIKLNWSSPKDAAWIGLNHSLQCYSPPDVHLFLKSSDCIVHDLTQPFKDCIDKDSAPSTLSYNLILRKWVEINPAHEFRCFVRGKKIIGVCQRDGTQCYRHIMEDATDILHDIGSFFSEQIFPKIQLENYVFDVVRSKKDNVVLVDINPFSETTDGLLFEWEELLRPELISESSDRESLPEFRYLDSRASGVRPNPVRRHAIPLDIAHLMAGEDPYKLRDLLKMRSDQAEEDDSD